MARRIRSKAVHRGRSPDRGTYKDDRHVRCARCGFICNLDRDTRHPRGSRAGWGIRYENKDYLELVNHADQFLELISGSKLELMSGSTIYDPIVTGGCPQCGTYCYNK